MTHWKTLDFGFLKDILKVAIFSVHNVVIVENNEPNYLTVRELHF